MKDKWSKGDPIEAEFLQAVADQLVSRMAFGAHTGVRFDGENILFSGGKKGRGGGGSLRPFTVYRGTADENANKRDVFIDVSTGYLSKDIYPCSHLDIEWLAPDQRKVEEDFMVWLKLDFKGQYETPKTPVLAKIEAGEEWGEEENDIFPEPIEWDTDDGTKTGSDPKKPDLSAQQIAAYVPIARIVNVEDEDYTGEGSVISKELKIIQILNTHLILVTTCYESKFVTYVQPWWRHFATPL